MTVSHAPRSRTAAALDAAIDGALADRRIVGTVVLVARDGQVAYRRAAGHMDREAGTPMREDAIFLLASVTKPIVTAAALRLVEEGRLDLHAPVTRWLPGFRPALPDGTVPEITLHQLLTHTAGLSYRFYEQGEGPYNRLRVSDGLEQPGLSTDENMARLAAAPLVYAPGTSWRYSLGLDVIGAVLEKADGRSLGEVVREKVTGPLGLQDTGFSVRDRSRLVTHYANATPEPVRIGDGMTVVFNGAPVEFAPSRIFEPRSYHSGGGGMAGTADDVLRILEAIRSSGAPILKPETVDLMTTAHVAPEAATQGPGWGFGYGGAVLVDPAPTGTPQAPGTLQWGGAYGHNWFIDRANRLTVVALTNTAFEGMAGQFTMDVRDAVYADLR
ncbi:MAG TPA: serine hydrolase domain-containing protein [Vicinamibacterales bacterium]